MEFCLGEKLLKILLFVQLATSQLTLFLIYPRGYVGGHSAYRYFATSQSASSPSSSPNLEERNKAFQQTLMGRYAMYVLSRDKKYSQAIKPIGSMEDASRHWCEECNRLYLFIFVFILFFYSPLSLRAPFPSPLYPSLFIMNWVE